MSRNVALVLGIALILVVGAVSITLAVSGGDEPVAVASNDDRFESVADEENSVDDPLDALGIDPNEILEALSNGATLTEIIEDNGGDPGEIAAAVEEYANGAIDDALEDGVIEADEADELRGFVTDTLDGLMNLPIGVLLGDLGLADGLIPGAPFEALPEDLREQFDEGDDGFPFGPFFEGEPPFDLDALPEDLPDEVRERLESLREELENVIPGDLLEGFDGDFFFDGGEIPEDLGQLFDEFFDGEGFRFDGDGFDFEFRFNEESEEEAA